MLTNKSVSGFLNELASHAPAPGGGSVAALTAALGAGLIAMVCRLTIGKKKYADVQNEMERVLPEAERLRELFTDLINKDTDAFNKVMEAMGLPKETDEQKALRSEAIQSTTKEATLVPLQVMHHCIDALALAKVIAEKGNVNAISDAGVATLSLHAGLQGAAFNVRTNLGGITDSEFVVWKTGEINSLLRTGSHEVASILAMVEKRMASG